MMYDDVFEVFILFSSPRGGGGGLVELLKFVSHSTTNFMQCKLELVRTL